MTASQALGLLKLGLTDEPFGGVAFEAERRGSDGLSHEDAVTAPSNGERACDGELALKLFCWASLHPDSFGHCTLRRYGNEVDLTEAPEEALADLLANLMHYCHREGIEWHGPDGVLATAVLNFTAESGGAAL